jgi:hypothetical protein
MSLRDRILATEDLPRKSLPIPEWGLTVHVRTLTGRERDRFEGQQSRDPYGDVRARLAVLALVDDQGQPLFTEADVPALSAKSSRALDRIFAVAVRLNGISKADLEELGKA